MQADSTCFHLQQLFSGNNKLLGLDIARELLSNIGEYFSVISTNRPVPDFPLTKHEFTS